MMFALLLLKCDDDDESIVLVDITKVVSDLSRPSSFFRLVILTRLTAIILSFIPTQNSNSIFDPDIILFLLLFRASIIVAIFFLLLLIFVGVRKHFL